MRTASSMLEPGPPAIVAVPAWTEFYAKDQATTAKLSWKDYCAEIAGTGKLFAAGVTAISTYAKALDGLAGQGKYAATDISDLASNAGSIAGSLGQAQK